MHWLWNELLKNIILVKIQFFAYLPKLWIKEIKESSAPTTGSPPPSLYGSITVTIWKRTLVWLDYHTYVVKSKGKTCMILEPSHVKQLSLTHVCKIGLALIKDRVNICKIIHCQIKQRENQWAYLLQHFGKPKEKVDLVFETFRSTQKVPKKGQYSDNQKIVLTCPSKISNTPKKVLKKAIYSESQKI